MLRHVAYSIAPWSLALSCTVLDRAADRRRDEEWLEEGGVTQTPRWR